MATRPKSLAPSTLLLALAITASASASASMPAPTTAPGERVDLGDFSLAELMDIEVTVASRAPQKLSEVPAAVYVVTGDEIRRAGHSSVMEALRMVPGFYVSHWENKSWDITSRGFGNGLAFTSLAYLNQLLVMIDGVEVYTPLFAGMWWAIQDLDINDIDRIEVIRGPGGVVWGANAVHGVVNIITKPAKDTQGVQFHVWNGNDDRHSGVRYGGTLGESGHYRAWAKRSEYDNPHGPYAGYNSEWWISSGGFQADWETDSGRENSLWMRGYSSEFGVIGYDLDTYDPYEAFDQKTGGQLSFKTSNPETGSTWHAYVTTDQQNLPTLADIRIDVYDLGYQRDLDLSDGNHLNWGAGVRVVDYDLYGDDPLWLAFTERTETLTTPRVFAVDTIDLVGEQLKLILGLQAQDSHYTGTEFQPSVRFQWIPSREWTVWTGVSRAVRTPSIEETHLTEDSLFVGNEDFKSESVLAYEFGVRKLISEQALVDLALFYNEYDDLHLAEFDEDTSQYHYTNNSDGHAYGAELALDYQVSQDLKLRGAYSYLSGHYQRKDDNTEIGTDEYIGKHVANMRLSYDISDAWEFDLDGYGVQGMGQDYEIAEYWRGDARFGYNPSKEVQLSLGVQDFNDPTRSELAGYDNIRRTIYFALTWRP